MKKLRIWAKRKSRPERAAIDIGVNNLMAVTFNTGDRPILINGRPLKFINQFYDKQKAKAMSFVGDRGTSNRIQKLTVKRNFKIKDYLHKQTTFCKSKSSIYFRFKSRKEKNK